MNKVKLFLLAFLCLSFSAVAQETRTLTLEETIELALENSRSAKLAETRRTLGYWNYQVFKSGLRPQLFFRGTLPDYFNRATPVPQPDGTLEFLRINQNTSDLSLGLEQVLPWTNTTVRFDTRIQRFDNFERDNTLWQGDPVGITLEQPLFQVNQFKWDRVIQPLRYEQTKRNYVQLIESTAQQAARRFFQLLVEQKNLEIATQNQAANDTVFKVEQGRYNIGTSTEDKLLQTELDLLTSQNQAEQAKLDVQELTLDLRTFIGLNEDVQIELIVPEDAPEFSIDFETALKYAKENRAEFLDFELDRLTAKRGIADARARRFSANLIATFGYNSPQTEGFRDVYDFETIATGSRVRLGFALPILDGGRNKARMNSARENQKLVEFNVEQDEINFEQEIANAVRNFDQIRNQITLAEKRQEIALRRFEITNGRYLAGKVDILQLTDARSTKDAAIRNYISSLQQYWDAYYQLRVLTLYDFQNNNLLYNPLLEYDPSSDSVIEMKK